MKFLTTDLPASIQTVEQVFVWAASVLDYSNKDATCVESLTSLGKEIPTKSITANVFFNDAPATAEYRFVSRGSLKVSPDYKLGPVWNYVNILSDGSVPDGFKK